MTLSNRPTNVAAFGLTLMNGRLINIHGTATASTSTVTASTRNDSNMLDRARTAAVVRPISMSVVVPSYATPALRPRAGYTLTGVAVHRSTTELIEGASPPVAQSARLSPSTRRSARPRSRPPDGGHPSRDASCPGSIPRDGDA